jgi:hypothetical protein
MDDQNMNVPGTDPFHYTPDAQPAQQPYAPAQPAPQTYAQPAPQTYAQPAQTTYAQPAPQTYAQPAQPTFTPPPFGTLPDVPPEYPTGMATASLVLGIISFVGFFGFYLFPPLFLLPIVGIILGAVYKSKHYPVGKGKSTAGIILSVLSLVISIAIIVAIIANLPAILDWYEVNYPELYEEYFGQLEQIYS